MKSLQKYILESSSDSLENIADEFMEEIDYILSDIDEDEESSTLEAIEDTIVEFLEYLDVRFEGKEQKAFRKGIKKFAKENK